MVDVRVLPNPAAGANDAQIMLVILIPHQFLVKTPKPLERLTPPAAEVHTVHQSLILRRMAPRSPDGERRLKCCGDGS
jgi:hypothetical protein